jgi:hypothetical protein
MIRRLFALLRRTHADDRGFTMVSVLGVMLVLGTFSAATWAAANGDLPLARKDEDRKAAIEAAQAGVQWYMHQLELSTNFWATCSPTTPGITIQGSALNWRSIGVNNESFAVEVMPRAGKTCDPNKLDSTLLTNGTLQIRVTGRYALGKKVVQRQLIASFRRAGFLDFVWYTKRETSPPAAYGGTSIDPSWVQNHCDTVRAKRTNGTSYTTDNCLIIDFGSADKMKGPMHTEDDSFSINGSPQFGRDKDDKIEVAGAGTSETTAYSAHSTAAVDEQGTLIAPANTIDPPKDNGALRNFADIKPAGNTCIQLDGNVMYVNEKLQTWNGSISCPDKSGTKYVLGDDTVVYVDNNTSCSQAYAKYQKYAKDYTCGNVAVWGTYNTNVTIGSANDIIVWKDLTRASGSDALMGLVANQFVRVYHPINYGTSNTCDYSTPNALSSPPVSFIDAAILATQGSFVNDNWTCGAPLGTLHIKGAIAQYWRGAVLGTLNGHSSGYDKDYEYDDRLKYREPPQFLDAATSQWHILRQTEQTPVKTGAGT